MTVFSHYLVEDSHSLTNLATFPKKNSTVFLTGGSPVMLAFAPSPVEVYNDLDSGVLYFFETLRSPARRDVLRRLLEKVPSFKEYDHYKLMEGYRDTSLQDDNRIALWYVCAREILKSHLQKLQAKKLFRRVGDYEVFKRNGKAAFVYRELQEIDPILPEVHGRLFRMQFEHYPFEKVIQIYDGPETLFIADLDHVSSVDDRKSKDLLAMLHEVQGDSLVFSPKVGDSDVLKGKGHSDG